MALVETILMLMLIVAAASVPFTIATAPLLIIELIKSLPTGFWPTTEGCISSQEEISFQRNIAMRKNRTIETLVYIYTVDNQEYVSNQVSFAPRMYQNMLWHNNFLNHKQVTVYYNPRKPHESVLLPGFSGINLPAIIINAILIVVQISFIIYFIVRN